MILAADDLIDWIADRDKLLIAAWTPELATTLRWERLYAEALADELHSAMITTLLNHGTERDFFKIVARSGTGVDLNTARAVAERFYTVNIRLARAASRHERRKQTRHVFPYLRAFGAADSRRNPGHLALNGIILPQGHSFWGRWHPPLDMDCRCGTMIMLEGQLRRSGETVTSDEQLADRESRLVARWPTAFEPLLDFRQR